MAVLKVPSQYSTIALALAAAAAGDDIEVDGGTHSAIAIPASKSSLRVRAKRGTQPVVSGTGALITIGSGSEGTYFEGLKFVRTGTATTAILNTLRQISFVDCVFDATNWAQTVGVSSWLQFRSSSGQTFRRCSFLATGALLSSSVLSVIGSSTSYIVEGCVFLACKTSQSVIVDATASPSTMIVRNNTLVSCSATRRAIAAEASGFCAVYNNVLYDFTATSPGSGTPVLSASGSSTFVANNIIHNNSGITTNLASPDSGNNTTADPLLDSDGRPTSASPCIGAGIALSGLGERRVHLDRDRRPYAETPDIGAYSYRRGQRSALYLRSPNVDVLSGVTFNVNAQGDVTPPSSRTSYESPWDTALALEHALTTGASRIYGPLDVWYDDLNDRYRMATYLYTFNLSITGASAKVFGSASETGISDTG